MDPGTMNIFAFADMDATNDIKCLPTCININHFGEKARGKVQPHLQGLYKNPVSETEQTLSINIYTSFYTRCPNCQALVISLSLCRGAYLSIIRAVPQTICEDHKHSTHLQTSQRFPHLQRSPRCKVPPKLTKIVKMVFSFGPVHARKLFDIPWASFPRAFYYACASSNSATEEASTTVRLEQLWAPSQTLVTLCVRSALDLLLQACMFPPGSEVIISAVTIPHMAAIIRLHGLVPVPVDLQCIDFSVSAADVEALVTLKTKAVLIAQLFGARHSLTDIAEVANRHGLLLVEDCAQAFIGREFVGSPEAAVSMFSFGPIKTCTALAGGLVTVRKEKLLLAMRDIHRGYKPQQRSAFFQKVTKYAIFKAITDSRVVYGLFLGAIRARGLDHQKTITKLSHSLASDSDLLHQIRLRPSVALLRLLHHRVSSFDPTLIDQRRRRLATYFDKLPASMRPLGYEPTPIDGYANHGYWICPVSVTQPREVLDQLLQAGFDAAAGDTSLVVVSGGEKEPVRAAAVMASVIYLPVDNVFNDRSAQKLVTVLAKSRQL